MGKSHGTFGDNSLHIKFVSKILSRRKMLEQGYIDRAMTVMNTNNLNRMFLKHTPQDCMERPT